MHWTDRRTRFREVLNGNRCVHPGSVYDAISARIAEDLGFELGMFAGSVASLTVLGAPDLIVLTLSEFAQQAYRINRAGKLPLMVDADHGYGNALNAKRTVEELETAGIAGMSIEDTDLPTPHGATRPRLTPEWSSTTTTRMTSASLVTASCCMPSPSHRVGRRIADPPPHGRGIGRSALVGQRY